MKEFELLCDLPGETAVRQGLADVSAERKSIPACLVSIASPRLQSAGLLSRSALLIMDAELELYRLLRQEGGDAYSRYNSLLRELVSFENALDHRLSNAENRKPKAEIQ